jgi:hypothetical protein
MKKIEELNKKNKKVIIMWKGIPYNEICKCEKEEVEWRIKQEIREEIESKKLIRGTTYSTYNRLMV